MDEATRLTIVYAIIGVLLLIGIPTLVVYLRRRKREKLRRRGIKTYGH
ncbi:LPXTG-motif cell wall-anchored protein [Sphingomonas melonis]|jgi:LPXTG-motif cell wall-anchored protein|uniref:LPXTG-motif cell wall-anchored protein n=1 Tax=Sphingomonas melonis TaxID=152682 RepID=A0A7Y9FLY3_9SPHN|nr:LPXTG-motif cell wall-anchored protein [Sphingomonas melonis]